MRIPTAGMTKVRHTIPLALSHTIPLDLPARLWWEPGRRA